MPHKLFVISGPSGVGKGTLVSRLLKEEKGVVKSVSCTTRSPREGEMHGKHYFFLSREAFEARIKNNDFLEYDEHFENLYGTPVDFVKQQLETKSVILEIDVVGGTHVRERMPEKCVLIFIDAPSAQDLEARLASRGTESEAERKKRLERVQYELGLKNKYDYVVVNDDIARATESLREIIRKETNGNEV